MAASQLSINAINRMANGEVATEKFPVLQIANITSNPETDKYDVLLSDGEFNVKGLLSHNLNDLVKSGKLQKGSLVKLNRYTFDTFENKKVIFLITADVILDKCDLIGVTKSYPAQLYKNVASVVARPSAPGKPMIQPAVTAGNSPSYNTSSSISGSAPRPTMGAGFAGSKVQPSGEDFNGGAHSHRSTFSGSMNLGRSNPSNVSRVHPKPEVGSGFQLAPMNDNVHLPNTSYIQPSPISANRGTIAINNAPPRMFQIAELTDCLGMWTIKARVTSKSKILDYKNKQHTGKLFTFDLLDSNGGAIRVICLNTVVGKFYQKIETGRVYMISNGTLNEANRKYNLLGHKNEIVLNSNSTVQPCHEDDKSIPPQQFSFKTIVDIWDLDYDDIVDLIAIVSSISPTTLVQRKDGQQTQKTTLQLKDMSGSIEFTMWEEFCNNQGKRLHIMCDSGLFPVLAVRAGKIDRFNGRSVGTTYSTQLLIDPDICETQKLKTWFNSVGKSAPAKSLSTVVARTYVCKTICQIKDENLGTNEKPDWITIHASIQSILTKQISYASCPLQQCKRELDPNENGESTWQCNTCGKSFEECDYNFALKMVIQDHTGKELVTAFEEEVGQEILGRSSKEMYLMKHKDKDAKKEAEVVRGAFFKKYTFRLKVEKDNYKGRQLVKSEVVEVEKYNLKTEAKSMLDLAKQEESDMGAGGY